MARMDLSDLHTVRPVAQALSHIDALEVGTRLAEYELQGLIGVGGFGMVYRAYDHNLQRTVAIKEYMPCAMAARKDDRYVTVRTPADREAYAAGLASFVNEARLLARFDHPSLVKVMRFWEDNGTAYMVMPLYKGVTLKQARGMLDEPPSEVWLRKVLWSVLQALKLLHDQHVLHRDISPDNIFLQDTGPPVLLDLGAARRAVGESTQRHTAVLKVNYAPIEQYAQADDLREGAWTDIYSLAAVIYGAVRNEPPQPATFRAMRDRLPTMVNLAKAVQRNFGHRYSREFAVAIDRALRIQPADRPQSVAAFSEMLRLQPPASMETFDWWREAEDVDPVLLPPRRALGWWHRRPRRPQRADPWTRTGQAWKETWQHGTGYGEADQSQVHTRHLTSTLEVPSTLAGFAPLRPHRSYRNRRLAMVMGLVLGLAAVLTYRAMDKPAAVMAAAPSQAAQPAVKASSSTTPPTQRPAPAAVSRPEVSVAVAQPPARRLVPKDKSPASPAVVAGSVEPRRAVAASVELCADSGFFARPMCVHRECQKPQYTRHPVCVEARERELARARSSSI